MNKRNKIFLAVFFFILPIHYLSAQDITSVKNEKAFKVNGNVSAGFDTYSLLSGAPSGYLNPFSWSVSANLIGSIYGISIPLSGMISNQSKAYSLPFTRFGISPYYKWVTLHLGWRSLNFSPFTLGGQNIFGVGTTVKYHQFHFDFIYGKFNKAITDISMYNNLNNSSTPVYSRKGFATQLGYGNDKNNVYLSYLSAKDDSTSISQDIKNQSQTPAAANQVIGLRSKVSFLKHAYWYMDAAASHYIRDQSVDTITTTNNWWKLLFSSPKNSSQLLTALETGFQWTGTLFGIGLKYRRVDPDYKSMGAFYLQTDIEQYSINPSLRLLQNKLFLSGSLGLQHDNLFDKNASRSARTIGMLNISYNPNQIFGIDAQYSNFGISQQLLTEYVSPNPNQPLYDSVRIDQVSQSITVSPHLIFINTKHINSITGSFSFQNLADKNPNTSTTNNFNSIIGVLTHSLTIIKSKWQLSQSLTYLNTSLVTGVVSNLGFTAGASKNIEKKKLTVNANASFYVNSLAGHSSGNTFNVMAGAGYVLHKNQTLQAGLGMIATNTNANGNVPANSSSQLTTYLRYNLSF